MEFTTSLSFNTIIDEDEMFYVGARLARSVETMLSMPCSLITSE